jgi:2-oxoglutarate dehydrogenase E1 component
MESVRNRPAFPPDQQERILRKLARAAGLENFLDRRYKGKKWFSLSGSESLIAMLDEIVEQAPRHRVEELTMGMAHRGRVNVLVNILHKTYEEIFTEFHETWDEDYIEGGGDVKYHKGYSTDFTTSSGHSIHLTMASNPSHLEFVNPVVLGRCRAKQRLRRNEAERDKVVPILIHGDASFPAQGIVAECLNLMRLDGYRVGGAVHIVVNNQIGYTTDPRDARSGRYCTDVAKMVEAPIFHVNGDDPEACVFVARVALEFRQTFKEDIVIDLWSYRKYGHNETDEPSFTQPLMYERIAAKTPVTKSYARMLIERGVLTEETLHTLHEEIREEIDSAEHRSKETPVDPTVNPFAARWAGLTDRYSPEPADTAAPRESLERIARTLAAVPEGFTPHPRLEKALLGGRREMAVGARPLDWAMGELLGYGTLLLDGHAVRLTGQDVERGTFSHRHAVLFDVTSGEGYTALNHIDPVQAKFCVHNSPLSEQSCVGYEYGYSLTDPNMLVVWEAQFGDFANGAQVIIDQFIASAEKKWQRHSGLVLLLPHGYEGQGPEHSSARLERFLQLCADENMQVIYPTAPAQVFHALRRQLKRNFRMPLVVMTPKSLLRHPGAVSTFDDLASGHFRLVIDDPAVADPARVARVLLCSGKVYFDLVDQRTKSGREDVAMIRLEQLYPFPLDALRGALERYPAGTDIAWVQEEPKNAGAYRHVEAILRDELDLELPYIGRAASASPAVGSLRIHQQEQQQILDQAIGRAAAAAVDGRKARKAPDRVHAAR